MSLDNMILSQLDQLDLNALYEITGMLTEFHGLDQIMDLKSFLLQIVHGNNILNGTELLYQLKQVFFEQVCESFSFCSTILLISILSGLLQGITDSFGTSAASKVGTSICMLTTITLSIHDFIGIYEYILRRTQHMVHSVQSLFPVLIPLTVASGSTVTGTTLQPMILTIITGISLISERWIFPAVFYSCALSTVGRMVDQSFLKHLGKLLRDAVIFSLGLTVTILSAFTSIQGAAGRTADSLLMKTARYSVDNFIPFIGGFAADSMDMVIHCTSAIKSAIGIWGIVVLLLLLLAPLMKLAGILLMYRCCSVLMEAVGAKVIGGCIEDISSALTTLAVVYTLLGILFIVFISIVIAIL